MTIEAKIIADSINPDSKRITTVQCRLPRFIWPQMLTHRAFARNAQSSRACPIDKMIEEVEKDPAMPIHWGANQRGMQANEECNELVDMNLFEAGQVGSGDKIKREDAWKDACRSAVISAKKFNRAGYHKQIVNRLLEPFMHISVIITATEWDNFFNLRLHDDAQPEIAELAKVIKSAMDESESKKIRWSDWHLPYACAPLLEDYTAIEIDEQIKDELAYSVASSARVSYNNLDGSGASLLKNKKLHDMLLKSKHMSPFEHQARAMRGSYANFNGWCSYRSEIENA